MQVGDSLLARLRLPYCYDTFLRTQRRPRPTPRPLQRHCWPTPYSFFTAFNYIPPIIGFSSTGPKDSLRNVQENGMFVWNLVTRPLAEAMNQTCAPVGPEVNEFELAGLKTAPSRVVDVPRVADSPVSFECRSTQIIQLEGLDKQKVPTWLVLGEVVGVHIASHLLKDGVYDTANAGHILRGGGPADYFSIGPEQLFKMSRPPA
jgi:flavin reductase (DIM6/NTAB) family NADH-FMN oxidoreductase RutF